MNSQTRGLLAVAAIVLVLFLLRKPIQKSMVAAKDFLFSKEQDLFINELHPKAQPIAREFVARVKNETGYDVLFTSGYRSFQKQAALDKEDSRNADAGLSTHNYGFAWDINLIGLNSKGKKVHLKKATSKADWEATGVPKIAKSMNLKWGGNFANYYDPVHFDVSPIINIPTSKLREMAIKQFGSIDKVQGNKLAL